jgi:hypothetical protein
MEKIMRPHYFQNYVTEENVHTANTMLLLSRLYEYSSVKFYELMIKLGILPEYSDPQDFDLHINMQERSVSNGSVPDAIISRSGFKIVVETKTGTSFDLTQLKNHLNSFDNNCELNILLTLSPNKFSVEENSDFIQILETYRSKESIQIIHVDLNFEKLIGTIYEIIDDSSRDYEFATIVDEFQNYCLLHGLIADNWKYLQVRPVSSTIGENRKYKLYYTPRANKDYKPKFFGLYHNKAVVAVGEITKMVTAWQVNGEVEIDCEQTVSIEEKRNIESAIRDARDIHGWDISSPHTFFIVDEFYDTDFRKASKYGLRFAKYFNLKDEIDGFSENATARDVALALNDKEWW